MGCSVSKNTVCPNDAIAPAQNKISEEQATKLAVPNSKSLTINKPPIPEENTIVQYFYTGYFVWQLLQISQVYRFIGRFRV
jgi:hypothetical protein